jgi:hypothetical protein
MVVVTFRDLDSHTTNPLSVSGHRASHGQAARTPTTTLFMPHLPSLAWVPDFPGLIAGQLARPRGLGPPRWRALHAASESSRAAGHAPGGVRPRIAAGKTILGGSGRASVPDPRQQGAHHGPIRGHLPRFRVLLSRGRGEKWCVLREWVPVLARGCRQLAATWIRLLGSEGRDLAWPCRSPCRRPRRTFLSSHCEATTSLGLPIRKVDRTLGPRWSRVGDVNGF